MGNLKVTEVQPTRSSEDKHGEATKQMLLKTIELYPQMASAHANLGRWYAQRGFWKQAVAYYQQAIRLQPDNFIVCRSLARAWKNLIEQEQASVAADGDVRTLPPHLPFLWGVENVRFLESEQETNSRPSHQEPQMAGFLDEASEDSICGWAANLNEADQLVTVDIYVDGEYVTSCLANELRVDVAQKKGIGEFHGFATRLPFGLDVEGTVSLQVKFRETNEEIPGSPKQVRIGPPGTKHQQETVSVEPISSLNSTYKKSEDIANLVPQQKVAILVSNLDGKTQLEKLFESFASYNSYPHYRFIVIDRGSQDNSNQVCERWSRWLHIEFLDRQEDESVLAAKNYAARLCDEEILLFLNNKIIFVQDILPEMLGWFADGQVGILSLQITRVGDKMGNVQFQEKGKENREPSQHLGIKFNPYVCDRVCLPYEVRSHAYQLAASSAVEMPAVTADCMMVRREEFLAVGGFYEDYSYEWEGVDFCLNYGQQFAKKILCANYIKVGHSGAIKDASSEREQKVSNAKNYEVWEQRVGAYVRKQLKTSRFSQDACWFPSPVRCAFAVSWLQDPKPGDYFTAFELGEFLVRELNWEVYYLPPEDWYNLKHFDLVVAMTHHYNPRAIQVANPWLVLVGWIRNWFDKWQSLPWLQEFSQLWVSSEMAKQRFSKVYHRSIEVIRIATNHLRFSQAEFDPNYASDYCFTGGYFHYWRQILDCIDPENREDRFALYGSNWEEFDWLQPFWRQWIPYSEMPKVYGSTKIVLDDANHTVVKWGSVNSRVFDALAAGSLVLTNGGKGSEEVFDGLLPVYDSKESLHGLLDKYLQDEPSRKELVSQLQQQVLQKHTYQHRAYEVHQALQAASAALRVAVRSPQVSNLIGDEFPYQQFDQILQPPWEKFGAIARIDRDRSQDRTFRHSDEVEIRYGGLSKSSVYTDPVHLSKANILFHFGTITSVALDELQEFDLIVLLNREDKEKLERQLQKSLVFYLFEKSLLETPWRSRFEVNEAFRQACVKQLEAKLPSLLEEIQGLLPEILATKRTINKHRSQKQPQAATVAMQSNGFRSRS